MLPFIALLLAAPEAAPACAPAGVQGAAAAVALGRKDDAAANAAIAPAAACPVTGGATYAAHVLAAEVAAHRDDWARVRALLGGTGIHPEVSLGVRAQFLLMRADQGLGDAGGFLGDRGLTVAADDAQLSVAGQKIETFRAGTATVTAYRTALDQGSLHRVLEFVAVPDDQAAYPATIMLTDDRSAGAMMAMLDKGKKDAPKDAGHAWFLDLYTCAAHSTLVPIGAPTGAEPAYAAVKARAAEVFAAPATFAARPPDHAGCATAGWLMPGFGLRR